MKKVLALVSSVLLIGASQAALAADAVPPQSAIAVVNVQQVFQQSPKIAELNKKLQSQFKPRQDKLVAQQKTLQDELDRFKKDSGGMKPKDRDALQKKIIDDQAALAKDASTFQQDLSKEQSKIMKTVLAQLNEIISSIAKQNNYSLVLDSQAVIFSVDGSDITKQVSQQFDKK